MNHREPSSKQGAFEEEEPIEEEEPEEEEEETQDMEEEELEPINIEVKEEEEPFEMFAEFQEEENDVNGESDYYSPTNKGSDFYAPSPMLYRKLAYFTRSKVALASLSKEDKGKQKMTGTLDNGGNELVLREGDTQDPQEVSSQEDVIATLLNAVTTLQEKVARNETANAKKGAPTAEGKPPPPFP
ncbi:protein Ycf2-like [Lycium barbarum]|uniref:protein Ycf2-like n=1 Tax=Lycium barbarum TaxID=112863 RepID=UPI00293EC124|nr:protein Ycf2-like [Lycium barbarum]